MEHSGHAPRQMKIRKHKTKPTERLDLRAPGRRFSQSADRGSPGRKSMSQRTIRLSQAVGAEIAMTSGWNAVSVGRKIEGWYLGTYGSLTGVCIG